jgi:heme exporter protein D
VLVLLWRAIPPWQPRPLVPTVPLWNYVYVVWGAGVLIVVGGLLVRSARARRAQITEFRQEMQREAWRQQAREARGLAPDDRGSTTVIAQGVWHQYMAPPESWSQRPRGIMILGLIVALVSGLALLYVEYAYFQVRWPSSRN